MPGNGAFTNAFSTAYDVEIATVTDYVTTTWSRSMDDHPRPRWPPWSRLWRHYRFPDTQLALLLWRDGTVVETEDLDDAELADAYILGGTVWYVPVGDWQAEVLATAGYEIIPYEGPVSAR